VALAILVAASCSPGFVQGMSRALAPLPKKTMVFGGAGHRTYLGCLSCSQYDLESVFNAYGKYGSAYGPESIFNHYSEFGSSYSATSACNPSASDPPVIVDSQGNYYGRLTVNRYRSDAPTGQLVAWLAAVCQQ
jgi:hypothetical protein